MRFTDHSKFDLISADSLYEPNEQKRSQSFVLCGTVLVSLLGFVAPAGALLTGITGPLSFIFIFIALSVYAGFIAVRGSIIAGWAATIPVLVTFNMGVPLTPYAGNMRVELLLVDIFLLTIGLFAIADGVDSNHSATRMFCRLSVAFAVLALFVGVITVAAGYSLAGVWLGVNQFRYPLIAFAGVAIAHRFGFRYLLSVLFAVLSLQVLFAVVESVLGHSIGLSYYGTIEPVPGILSEATEMFGVTVNTGLYPGGFVGTSRALLAMLLLVFPVALFWVGYCDARSPAACGVALGTPVLVVISQSNTGLVLLPLSVGALLVATHFRDSLQRLSLRHGLTISAISVVAGSVLVWFFLTQGIFSNSQIRVEQYRIAWRLFMTQPLIGIGGQNVPIVLEMSNANSTGADVLGVHNTFLAYLTEFGVGGLLIYLITVSIGYALPLQRYLSARPYAVEFGATAIGLVSFHAYSSLTLMYQRPPVMMIYWLVSGAAVAAATVTDYGTR